MTSRLLFLLIPLLFGIGSPSPAPKFKEAFTGTLLPQYDQIWETLHEFYDDSLPRPIYLAYTQGGTAMFRTPDIVILSLRDLVDDAADENDDDKVFQTVAHEASHLGTFALTNGQSLETPFRFIDEGLAGIWQFYQNVDGYKQYTMPVAKDYLRQGKVSFAQIQDWDRYFGNSPETFDYNAYNVGSSFVFFVVDRFGYDGLKRLLVALGQYRDLDGALTNALGLSKQEAEDEWKAYIDAH